jgi:hypothetical protein
VWPIDHFPKNKHRKTGRYPYCRYCNREQVAKWRSENPDKARRAHRVAKLRKYGLTPEDYEVMLQSQDGRCAICGTDEPGHVENRLFDVDHDHVTGKVRGLLCQHCNMGMGQFGDDSDRLRKAADYLERTRV